MAREFDRDSVADEYEAPTMDVGSRTELAATPSRADTLPASAARAPAPGAAGGDKYEVVRWIGGGGMGDVLLIRDRDLRREIAMKVIKAKYAAEPAMRQRFLAEAQATAQLDHPGIPPVHDVGRRADGSLYFTMKVVRGKTFADVLDALRANAADALREYTLHRLVSILERLAETLEFAHEKGVLHRDLKPGNVMLGSYGEIHVIDWGLAKVGVPAPESAAAAPVLTEPTDATIPGAVQGTVAYMSPEQSRGEPLDRRTDVYALGAILYEVLTLRRAFESAPGETWEDIRGRVGGGRFPPVETRNPDRPVPEALASLCRRAMALDAGERPATARAFGNELRAWLDGSAEAERRHAEAQALAAEGRTEITRYETARDEIEAAEHEAREAAARLRPWQSIEEKAPMLDARSAAAAARRKAILAFGQATKLLEAALVAEPANPAARAHLADLWRMRLDDAERRRDAAAAADADLALTMVRRYDDGRLASYVAGESSLTLTSDPPGAEVTVAAFEDERGILRLGEPRPLGRTPLAGVPLRLGSYLCTLRRDGFPDVRYPVHITRGGGAWNGRVKLRTRDELGEGFVYVPGGPFVFGEGKETSLLTLPDFAIAERPVTFAEWAEFLDAIERDLGPDAVAALVPGTAGDGPFMERGAGGWRVKPGLADGPAYDALVARHGAGFVARWPVVGIAWREAVEFCAWKTRTTGREWRLPTEEEREKAARGVDGRTFPWGDLEDSSLARCKDSREEPMQPEPVGSFPLATSVYGMVDAAGNAFDWTDSWFDVQKATRVLRGGSWDLRINGARCAYRNPNAPATRNSSNTVRPARSLR